MVGLGKVEFARLPAGQKARIGQAAAYGLAVEGGKFLEELQFMFQAFGKGRISLFLGVTRWLVFNIPILFILNAVVGMYGIVWSQVTADTLTVLMSFFVFRAFRPKFGVSR